MQTMRESAREARCRVATDEIALVQAALHDHAAFGQLYESYLARVYAYLLTRTASTEDAADLAQQVFLYALRALPHYCQQRGTFAVWLFRIARNVAVDHHRRRRLSVPWDRVPEALHPRADDGPEAGVLHREALDNLRQVVLALPADKRELLALRFAGQCSLAEMAGILGKSEAAVKKQLMRTLRALKEQYCATT